MRPYTFFAKFLEASQDLNNYSTGFGILEAAAAIVAAGYDVVGGQSRLPCTASLN